MPTGHKFKRSINRARPWILYRLSVVTFLHRAALNMNIVRIHKPILFLFKSRCRPPFVEQRAESSGVGGDLGDLFGCDPDGPVHGDPGAGQ